MRIGSRVSRAATTAFAATVLVAVSAVGMEGGSEENPEESRATGRDELIWVEGTESVLLRDPVLRPDGTAEVTLVNTNDDKTLVTWQLVYDRDGIRNTRYTAGGWGSPGDLYPEWGPPSEGNDAGPGATVTSETPFPARDDLADGRSVGLVLDVVIFDDYSFEGEAWEAEQIFAWHAEELARRERWMPRIRELVRTTHTAEAAIPRLKALWDEIDAREVTPEFGLGDLQQEIHDTIEHLRRSPEHAVPILEEYLRFAEAHTEVTRRGTPPAYRPDPEPELRR